jgi:hypothetical protein
MEGYQKCGRYLEREVEVLERHVNNTGTHNPNNWFLAGFSDNGYILGPKYRKENVGF